MDEAAKKRLFFRRNIEELLLSVNLEALLTADLGF
jgi:hypothetical protein